jgi:hypothetical protein
MSYRNLVEKVAGKEIGLAHGLGERSNYSFAVYMFLAYI